MPSPQLLTLSSGLTYAYTHHPSPSSSSPTFLLLHGFPSTSLIWTRLTTHLTHADYGVLSLSLLGYAPTSTPTTLDSYALSTIISHVLEVLQHLGLTRVIGVGHDWGAVLLTRMWWYAPDVLTGLVFMGVPYQKPARMDLEGMNRMTREMWGYEGGGYWEFLTGSGAGDVLKKNTRSALSIFYSSDDKLWKEELCPTGKLRAWFEAGKNAPREEWMVGEEMEALVESFERGGWDGGLCWYKAAVENLEWEKEKEIGEGRVVIKRPVTFVVGEKDAVGRADVAAYMAEQGRKEGYLPDVEVEVMKGVAHWMMLEAPEETFKILDRVAKKVSGV